MQQLLWLFFAYSFLGWAMEVVLKYFQYGRWINRGFLVGPYCPIYGTGAVIVTVAGALLEPVDASYGTSFLLSFFLCGALEYMTSYVLEKRFYARWWDYSQKPMNLHGRVWIGNLILFGIGGVCIEKAANPVLLLLFARGDRRQMALFLGALAALFLADVLVSYFVMHLLKEGVEKSMADKSEEIAAEVRYLLENRSALHKRILDAYPELTFRTDRVKARIARIRKEGEHIRRLAEEKVEDLEERARTGREMASKNLVTTRGLQREIIEKQEALIDLLRTEDGDRKAIEQLEEAISADKALLESREFYKRLP